MAKDIVERLNANIRDYEAMNQTGTLLTDARNEICMLRELVKCLIENDPHDVISDAGHTVIEHWRHDARRALGMSASQ